MSNIGFSKIFDISAFKRSDSSMIRFKCFVLAVLYEHNCEHCKWNTDGYCECHNYINLYNIMK